MREDDPASRKRLETRILQHRKMPGNDDEYGAQYWYGYTYLWNDEQTDAELLGPAGLDREYAVKDESAAGGSRMVKWHFPSRAECTLCHTMAAKYVLGVTTLQMNKDHDYGGVIANQLATLDHLKIFKTSLAKPPEELPRLADYRDAAQDRHLRARAYLHANCAHCHRKWGGGNAEFELQASFPLRETKSVNTPPGQGALGWPIRGLSRRAIPAVRSFSIGCRSRASDGCPISPLMSSIAQPLICCVRGSST